MAIAPQIEIEKDVPLPNGANGRAKYPWGKMEVGDSFFVPGVNATKLANAYSSYRSHSGGKHLKFTARTVEGGARVWRVA